MMSVHQHPFGRHNCRMGCSSKYHSAWSGGFASLLSPFTTNDNDQGRCSKSNETEGRSVDNPYGVPQKACTVASFCEREHFLPANDRFERNCRFNIKEDVTKHTLVKNKDQRAIRTKLLDQYKEGINDKTMDQLIPKNCLSLMKWCVYPQLLASSSCTVGSWERSVSLPCLLYCHLR